MRKTFTPFERRMLAGLLTPEEKEDNKIVYKNWTRRELRWLSGNKMDDKK